MRRRRYDLIDELSSELHILAMMLDNEGQYQRQMGYLNEVSDMTNMTVKDDLGYDADITIDMFLQAISIVLDQIANRLKMA